MNSESQWKQDLKSPWLRGIIGTVLVALIANGTLIVLSHKHPHSLVAKDYYDKGKKYFHARTDSQDKAANLGYKLDLIIPDNLQVEKEDSIRLEIFDRHNNSVKDGFAILYAYRTNDNTKDFQLTLRTDNSGQFTSKIKFSLPGTWDLIAQITISGEKLDVAKRIFVSK